MPIKDFLESFFGFSGSMLSIDQAIIDLIKKEFKRLGYVFFEDDRRPYNVNIIGLRKLPKTDWNAFDDTIMIVCKDDYKAWRIYSFPITTMPGTSVLENPQNTKGTAILKSGQYRGMWEIGKHKGEYDALRQKGICTVHRYKDGKIVMEDTGDYFGINCHKAGTHSTQVDGWSAGCQVHQMQTGFDFFMHLMYKAKESWGNSFTYTLLEI